MQNRRVYFLGVVVLLLVFALPYFVPVFVNAQDSLDFSEEINLDELALPEDDDDLSIPSLPSDEVEEEKEEAKTPPPPPPMADFTPPSEEEEADSGDSEIEALLLNFAKEEEAEQTGETTPTTTDSRSDKMPELIESEPKAKWWEDKSKFQNQVLPEIIYKKEYEKRNDHLPKAFDLSDLERWLFKTAADGDLNGTRAILNKNTDPDPRNIYGNTPLILAALHCRVDTLRLLLARGANPNAQNKLGLSALHIASYKGCTNIAKALLHMSANPNLKNAQGFTPIEFAATNKHYAVAQLLLNNGAERTSRFFSGMLHEKSLLNAIKHGKERKDLPDELPDAEILEEALGITPDGDVIEDSSDQATTEIVEDGMEGTEGIGAEKGKPYSSHSDDGKWQQTKGGRWIKIGGSEPPQGVAGIYWHEIENIWYPLDPNEQSEAGKITILKDKLGHNDGATPPASLSAPWEQKSSAPAEPAPSEPAEEVKSSSIPAEVIEDMKPALNGEIPTQGVGGVWWHEVDGEWQPLDPEVKEEQAEIDRLKAIHGTPLEHNPTPPPADPPAQIVDEAPEIIEEPKAPELETDKPSESEPTKEESIEMPASLELPSLESVEDLISAQEEEGQIPAPILPEPAAVEPEVTIKEAIMPEIDTSDIPIEPKTNEEFEALPDFTEEPIGLLPEEGAVPGLEGLELPDSGFEPLPDIPLPTGESLEETLEEEDELPGLPDLMPLQ